MWLQFLVLFFVSSVALAKPTFTIGTSIYDLRSTDPNFRYAKDHDLKPNFIPTFGVFDSYNKIVYGFNTNRPLNRDVKRKVVSNKNGRTYDNYMLANIDSIFLGYRVNRLIPSLFIARANVTKTLNYQNETVSKKIYRTNIYGLNLSYFLTKNFSVNAIYIAKNKTLLIDNSFGLGINYNF